MNTYALIRPEQLAPLKTVAQRVAFAREKRGWTQAQLAIAAEVAQSTIGNIETGSRDGGRSLPQIARALGVRYDWLKEGAGPIVGRDDLFDPIDEIQFRPVRSWEHESDLPACEYVLIPRLNIAVSAGHGKEQVETDLVKETPQAFRADWIRRLGLKPNRLACLTVKGDSMEPRICEGDSVVVDLSDTTVTDGRVYVVWYDGGERIKRLYRLPGGGLRVASDNTAKYQTMDLTAEQAAAIRIIGRIRHVSGVDGL